MLMMSTPAIRSEIAKIEIPKRTDVSPRWRGVRHGDLLEQILISTKQRALKLYSESYQLAKEGADLFGELVFETPMGISLPEGTRLSLGFRHSNMSRYALTFAIGGTVMVCSNGIITGEFVVRRKHTTGVNLPAVIDEGIDKFLNKAEGIETFIETLRNRRCHNAFACRFIVESGRRGVLPWAQLNKVQERWFEPAHKEFEPRNWWSLYNAFTETIRDRANPGTQMKELKEVGLLMERWTQN